ncbi:hypothetical protein QTP88_009757 [Uroleucon formosanum]
MCDMSQMSPSSVSEISFKLGGAQQSINSAQDLRKARPLTFDIRKYEIIAIATDSAFGNYERTGHGSRLINGSPAPSVLIVSRVAGADPVLVIVGPWPGLQPSGDDSRASCAPSP